jgi:hypothetical protein
MPALISLWSGCSCGKRTLADITFKNGLVEGNVGTTMTPEGVQILDSFCTLHSLLNLSSQKREMQKRLRGKVPRHHSLHMGGNEKGHPRQAILEAFAKDHSPWKLEV